MATEQQDNKAEASAGAALCRAREQAGLSREQMAERLNLRLGYIIAMEQDDYARLPGYTFTHGYLRNYARALKLDEGVVLGAYAARRPQPVQPARAADRGRVRWRPVTLEGASTGPRRHWGITAVVLVVAALWGWQRQGQLAPEVLPLTPDSNSVSLTLPGGLGEAQPLTADNPLDSVELLPAATAALPLTVTAMGADGQAAPGVPAVDRLNLHFSADCWVEIKDRDNKVLVAMLKRADEQLQIEGRGPFKVLLGFAPGVEMAYNGQPVDIEVPSGARSARLIVGSS